jgi:c(7)-type cytochrome triheme protein
MSAPQIRALCGFGCALLALAGALAQPQAADPFGALPEPPTENIAKPVHDSANPDFRRLQPAQEAFSALPLDRQGKPDWMRALRENRIQPRGAASAPLQPDILMKNTAQMPYVNFPHKSHGEWLACANCHDAIFAPRAGAARIDMQRIFLGETCGVCHGRVAFTPLAQCERCHSVPQPGQKAWW